MALDPSITTWTRLEPRARASDMRSALEARVHDPLWLLARQWQVGEFQGEDAGTPIKVQLQADVSRLTTWRAGPEDAPAAPYPGGPLEALVEGEGAASAWDAGLAADAGAHFLRLLAGAGLGAHRAAFARDYPLAPPDPSSERADAASVRQLRLFAGRFPDGAALAAALRPAVRDDRPPALPVLPPEAHAPLLAVARAWLAWVDTLVAAPRGDAEEAWQPRRLEHRFALSTRGARKADGTPDETVLEAREYPGGRLDWHAFGVAPGKSLPAEVPGDVPVTRTLKYRGVPAPLSYPGMPSSRWWQFEDARVDFGQASAGPEDLAQLLVLEFASVFSNDWYLVPVRMPVGSLCRVREMEVTDTFGKTIRVGPVSSPDWSLFRPTRWGPANAPAGREELFFLAPTLADGLESAPVEDVLFFRDEAANLAWAVERTVPNAVGRPLDRHAAWARRPAESPAVPVEGAPPFVYRLGTRVPEHWIPMVFDPAALLLRLAPLPRAVDEGGTEQVLPLGGVLRADTGPFVVHEEEVPWEGAQVTRAWQRARWSDGSTWLWLGRQKRVGRGAGWSGLRFDTTER